MACEICYEYNFQECGEALEFDLGLDATTDFTLLVRNAMTGQQYSYAATSDSEGVITWPEADQPAALFVPFNGPFSLTIVDSDNVTVEFTVGYETYGCVEFRFVPTTTITPA